MPDLDLLDSEIVFEDDILPDHAGETIAVMKASLAPLGRGCSRTRSSRSSWRR